LVGLIVAAGLIAVGFLKGFKLFLSLELPLSQNDPGFFHLAIKQCIIFLDNSNEPLEFLDLHLELSLPLHWVSLHEIIMLHLPVPQLLSRVLSQWLEWSELSLLVQFLQLVAVRETLNFELKVVKLLRDLRVNLPDDLNTLRYLSEAVSTFFQSRTFLICRHAPVSL